MDNDSRKAATFFRPQDLILDVQEYGSGNVNDTFLVTLDSEEKCFVLQRINTVVFRHPELIMLNMRTFSEHVRKRLESESTAYGRRWEVPCVIPARDGADYALDENGRFWRAMSFVSRSRCYETVQSAEHAREAGYALARFHSLISDLETDRLYDTLEGFHITPQYLRHYDEVLARADLSQLSPEVRYGLRFVEQHRKHAAVLEDAKAQGRLPLRPIHGDPKINNIMIDEDTAQAVSIVDLDTVKPGLIHYDIGDCLRSCCNPAGEETTCIDDVHFDTDLCQAILDGYFSVASSFMNGHEHTYIYDSVHLISFELGLRFFTDYLEGNVYFKARYPEHNLSRALVQFKLAESIEAHEDAIRTITGDLRRASLQKAPATSPTGSHCTGQTPALSFRR